MQHTPSHSIVQQASRWTPAAQQNCDHVISLVAREKRVPIRLLAHERRGRKVTARARQLAMYLSHVIYGWSLAEVGAAFGRDRTTVSYACALIEDLRDDPAFDAEVCALEQQLEAALAAGVAQDA